MANRVKEYPRDMWAEMETAYITSQDNKVSYKFLSERYGIPVTTVNQYANRNHWVDKRKKYRESLIKETLVRERKKDVNKLSKLMLSADMLSEAIEKVFQDSRQFYRHVVRGADGVQQEVMLQKVAARAIRDMTSSLRDLSAVVRNLYDLPTLREQQAQALAAERLLLEKKKAAGGAEQNEETGVILIPDTVKEDAGSEAARNE